MIKMFNGPCDRTIRSRNSASLKDYGITDYLVTFDFKPNDTYGKTCRKVLDLSEGETILGILSMDGMSVVKKSKKTKDISKLAQN